MPKQAAAFINKVNGLVREIVARSCHGDEVVVVAVGQAYVKYWSSNGLTIKSGACYYYLRMITIHYGSTTYTHYRNLRPVP